MMSCFRLRMREMKEAQTTRLSRKGEKRRWWRRRGYTSTHCQWWKVKLPKLRRSCGRLGSAVCHRVSCSLSFFICCCFCSFSFGCTAGAIDPWQCPSFSFSSFLETFCFSNLWRNLRKKKGQKSVFYSYCYPVSSIEQKELGKMSGFLRNCRERIRFVLLSSRDVLIQRARSFSWSAFRFGNWLIDQSMRSHINYALRKGERERERRLSRSEWVSERFALAWLLLKTTTRQAARGKHIEQAPKEKL